MKNYNKIYPILSLIFNIANVLLVVTSILWYFIGGGVTSHSLGGMKSFRYFTNDSNILSALCSLIMIPFIIRQIFGKDEKIPSFVLTCKAVASAEVMLTMIVVLFFLGPTQGYDVMYDGVCLALHLICPLLSIISFCFFERGSLFTKRRLALSMIPAAIYATFYLVNVVLIGCWRDFYGFNIKGLRVIIYIVIILAAYVSALIIGAIHNAVEKSKAI
ncbi:MAG: hypothetical protein J5922_02785 [Clostridia bacterium]|nr:hypothetical protein [Clostridia bacterium]